MVGLLVIIVDDGDGSASSSVRTFYHMHICYAILSLELCYYAMFYRF